MCVCVTLFNNNVFQQRLKTPTNEIVSYTFFVLFISHLKLFTFIAATAAVAVAAYIHRVSSEAHSIEPELNIINDKKKERLVYIFLFRYFVFVRVLQRHTMYSHHPSVYICGVYYLIHTPCLHSIIIIIIIPYIIFRLSTI